MSHPPEHIPDIDNQTPARIKSPKEKELKDKTKDKVRHFKMSSLIITF